MPIHDTQQSFFTLPSVSVNRRTLLKRAGLVGVALPFAGGLVAACGNAAKSSGATAALAATPSVTQPAASAEPIKLTITAKDLAFTPTELTAERNQPIILTFVNTGAIEHDWMVMDLPVTDYRVISKPDTLSAHVSDQLNQATANSLAYAGAGPGQQMVIEFTPAKSGQFMMMCTIPGHSDAGMHGAFTISDAAASAAPSAAASPVTDDHVMPSTVTPTGVPYAADRLPQPAVAAAIGSRGPQLVTYEVDIVEKIGYLDEGVAYTFWTFGGTVPGPMLRARVGDNIELTLRNPADAKMAHNIDLHAVTGPGGGAKMTQLAPGQSATFRWKALHPGAFVYHCATAPIPEHISSGMYGMVVIEPEGGLPPVDREFYVMQGDFYLEGARGEKGLRAFSNDKLYDERPDYIVFNGAVGSLLDERALKANVGEKVRLFFGVGGPNVVSSLHVIGAIFDRVAQESAAEWSTHVQTTLVPAGGATIAEFTFQVPGGYTIVDHSLGRLAKGAVGMIEVAGDATPGIIEQIQAPA